MKVIKVQKSDTAIIHDILTKHIDDSDRRAETPNKPHMDKLLEDDRTYLLAAVVNDEVAGYTLAYRFPSLYAVECLAYLYDIEVAVAFRRRGIGKLLVQTVLDYLKADGVKEVWLGTAVDNAEGQALFQATGGIKSGETFNDYTYYLT